jgi:hypothetical protein
MKVYSYYQNINKELRFVSCTDKVLVLIHVMQIRSCCGRNRMVDLQLPIQSVPITTNIVSLNPSQDVLDTTLLLVASGCM